MKTPSNWSAGVCSLPCSILRSRFPCLSDACGVGQLRQLHIPEVVKYVAILSSQLFGLNLCLKEARLKDYNFGQGSRAFWDIQREKTTEALTGKGFWAEMGLYEVST